MGCAVPVAGGLDEGDANKVVVALDQAGVDASKEPDPGGEGRFRVTVPRDDAARALAAMSDAALPREKPKGILEATGSNSQLVPSQAAEHAELAEGLAGELERTLGGVDGVLFARVHLNLATPSPLRDARDAAPKSTASVLVAHRGSTPPIAAESIQRLVAGGAPGLAPADVAVIFVSRPARAASAMTDLAHVGPISVARGSSTMLKGALAGLALIVVGLAVAVLGLYAKAARLARERDEARAARGKAA